MVFSSIIFLCYFLPLSLAIYYALPRFRNEILLGASLFFYTWGEPRFVPVLAASVLINYYTANLLQSTRRRRLGLALGLVANVLLLGFFKYINFISLNLHALTGYFIPGAAKVDRIPLGISFFTFQAMSYLVDVYRGDAVAEKRIGTVALYITMFPQLIAGPIVRFKDIVEAIHARTVELEQVAIGARVFVIGLASKVLIANTLAIPADAAFGLAEGQLGADLAWFGLLCYTLQIYFDFAGYSWMAIGLGHMLGFRLPRNFDLPYYSHSITEFWRRWHLSLSTWFRDYLYIPLGGNRYGNLKTYRNLVIVFLLCGLWHGANWTFVLWGAYHGTFLIVERHSKRFRLAAPRFLCRLYAIIIVAGGWVLFRSDNLAHAFSYLGAMFSIDPSGMASRTAREFLSIELWIVLIAAILLSGAAGNIASRCRHLFFERQGEISGWAKSLVTLSLLVLCMASLASGTHNPFIYFNF